MQTVMVHTEVKLLMPLRKKGSFESPQNNSAKTPASLNVLGFKTGVKKHGLFELVPPE